MKTYISLAGKEYQYVRRFTYFLVAQPRNAVRALVASSIGITANGTGAVKITIGQEHFVVQAISLLFRFLEQIARLVDASKKILGESGVKFGTRATKIGELNIE